MFQLFRLHTFGGREMGVDKRGQDVSQFNFTRETKSHLILIIHQFNNISNEYSSV